MCCACLTLCASSLPPGVSFLQCPGHVACLVRRCGIPLGRGWALPFNPGRLGIALSSWFDLSVGCFSTSPSACSRCSLPWIVPGCCWARSVSYALVSRMLLYSSGPAIDYMRGPIATHPVSISDPSVGTMISSYGSMPRSFRLPHTPWDGAPADLLGSIPRPSD